MSQSGTLMVEILVPMVRAIDVDPTTPPEDYPRIALEALATGEGMDAAWERAREPKINWAWHPALGELTNDEALDLVDVEAAEAGMSDPNNDWWDKVQARWASPDADPRQEPWIAAPPIRSGDTEPLGF